MRLLLDQNLSLYLIERLDDVYPGSMHVSGVGLERAQDNEVWEYARQNNLSIVTKDADFIEMNLLHGSSPNIIWIRRGNCSTQEIEEMLRSNRDSVEHLVADPEIEVVELH